MKHEGVHEWFSKTAEACGPQPAISGGAASLTYGELEDASNALANLIISSAAPRGSLVAILADEPAVHITGMLGVLKAGCAFVPLDPKIPHQRLRALVSEVSPEWFVVESKFCETLGEVLGERAREAKVISAGGALDEGCRRRFARLEDAAAHADTSAARVPREPDEMAYIYFTSGSTGRPKGIAGRLKGIDHFVRWEIKTFGVGPGTRVSQLTTPMFDAFLRDSFTPLCAGGTVCVPPERGAALDPAALAGWIEAEGVNLIHCVPSLFRLFSGEVSDPCSFSALKYVLLSGERVLPADVRRWVELFGERIPLVNLYGPTETTMTKFFYVIRPEDKERRSIPIGKPMEGARALVVNELGAVCPQGTVGEIYIRTPYRTLGYYNQPELTKESFLQNPFSGDPNDIVYRTGDLGRVLEDGDFEFVGRKDQQVKIRGVRIELGEIENLLRGHEAVRDVAVTDREDASGNKYLCAYVVLDGEAGGDALRDYLSQRLPAYTMPSAFVKMTALPRTPTGKVDRRALPSPGEMPADAKGSQAAPRTPVEQGLVGIWAHLLGVPQVGVHDNFFESGGHSLLATQLLSRVRDAFKVEIPVINFFESPTPAGLAAHVEAAMKGDSGLQSPPIVRVERNGGPGPALSFAQQRLWFLDKLEPANPAYNISSAVRLSGPLDGAAFARAFAEILRRHEVLRTDFTEVGGVPVQSIAAAVPVPLTTIDLSELPPVEREAAAALLRSEEPRRPFELSRGPLLRVTLLRMGEREHIALLTMHHIVSDAWSMGVLVNELSALYEAFVKGEPSTLPELAVQYADYAHWQRQWLSGEVLESHLAYWKQKLGGGAPVLELPTVRPRPPVQTFRGAREPLAFSEELSQALREFCLRQKVTSFMALLAAFKTLLYRYTNQEEITVGSPIANRNRSETEPLIGFFVNTLVLRTEVSGDLTFAQLLARVRDAALAAYAHQDLPFEKMVETLQPVRDLSYTPLFQVMFTLQNAPAPALKSSDLKLELLDSHTGTAKFDLEAIIVDRGGALTGAIEYNTDLFDDETIKRMLGHFQRLLESAVADPGRKISDLPLLGEAESRRLLVGWNDTAADFTLDRCFHELFEAQVARRPGAVAATFRDRQLTYAELNARANRVAWELVGLGVGPDVPVALLAERGFDFLTAVLGVFKAGGAYLPLDPAHPTARLRGVLERSGCGLVLTTKEFARDLSEALAGMEGERPRQLLIDELLEGARREDDPPPRAKPGNLAYVIYTSGSTGVPKGAMVEQRGMLNHLQAKVSDLSLTAADVVAQTASQCFDISVWQMLAPLLVGGRVCVFDDEAAHDAARLLEEMGREEITVFEAVPTLLRAALDHAAGSVLPPLPWLRWMVVTGEALPPRLCRQWLAAYPSIPLVNAYGPTECSDDVTHHLIDAAPWEEAARVPIGRPIANTRLYVLEGGLRPVPVGMSGELYVGGVGVGRGYLHDAVRTAERFVPDALSGEAGGRLYKTGDVARWLPDGSIEFLGRVDYQVKLRGFRVELGEIEATLTAHPSVREAVVVAREDAPGDKRLAAYLVPGDGGPPGTSDLRDFVKQRLPEYMVPSAFVVLDALPLTANGKVDRKALPAPEGGRPELTREFTLPRTPDEERLADIWGQVLRVERVGIHDNFFELGGDSILMIQIISKANAVGLRFTLRQFFQHQTVAELSALVSQSDQAPQAGQDAVTGSVPLTPAQHWLVEQNLPETHHFNLALILEVPAASGASPWPEVVRQILLHHDALRLRLVREGAGWRQFNEAPGGPLPLSLTDLSEMPEGEQARALTAVAADLQTSLDLSEGPIARFALFYLGEGRPSRLLIVVHHMAMDGVSWRILVEDILLAYDRLGRGEPAGFPPKTTSFKRWAERLQDYAQSAELQPEAGYWLAEPRRRVRRLPTDFPRGANTVDSAQVVNRTLTAQETRLLLQSVPAVFHTRVAEVLLTALAQSFRDWTGRRRLLVDLEGHGREDLFADVDVSRTLGWFTAIYPVLLDLGETRDVADALEAIKEQLRAVPNQGVGYGLLRYLGPDAEIGEALKSLPQSEVIFNYLGQFDNSLAEAPAPWGLAREPVGATRSPRQGRRYLLEINGAVSGERLHLTWKYSENLHKRSTIERLADGFVHAAQSIIEAQGAAAAGRSQPAPELPGLDQAKLDKVLAELKLDG